MLSCNEVSRDVASDALRTAGLGRRLAIRVHLMMCDNCRRFAREIEALGGAVRRLATPPERERRDAEERILRRLSTRLADEPSGPVGGTG